MKDKSKLIGNEQKSDGFLRVVHLNASSAGGAFVAAQRLSLALQNLPSVESEHWVFEGGEGDFYLWADSWIKKKWAFGLHALEKLDFLQHEREKKVRFAFSHGKTGVSVDAWDCIDKADVIHLHWINKGFISLKGLNALLSLGKRVVWTCHDMWPFTGGCYHPRGCDHFRDHCGNCHYLKLPSEKDLSSRVFAAKKAIYHNQSEKLTFITPSSWLKNQAESSGIFNVERDDISKTEGLQNLEVIANPIDTDYFVPCNEILEGEKMLAEGMPLIVDSGIAKITSKFVLMFAAANLGNLAKGFAEFRDLCNGLFNEGYTQIEALIVGENRLDKGELGLKCKSTSLGFISDSQQMRDAYWCADVYVTTSHEENLPTTIMESLSCGVPVAAFAVGGIPEMIANHDHHRTGWLVEKLDIKTLQLSIASYIDMPPNKRNQIKLNCRAAAIEKYSAKTIAEKYLAVYMDSK